MVFWGGSFGMWWGHEGEALLNGISALLKKSQRAPSLCLPWEVTVGNDYQWGSRLSSDTESAWTMTLEFPSFRIIRNKCLLFTSHLVYGIFVTVAWMDYEIMNTSLYFIFPKNVCTLRLMQNYLIMTLERNFLFPCLGKGRNLYKVRKSF